MVRTIRFLFKGPGFFLGLFACLVSWTIWSEPDIKSRNIDVLKLVSWNAKKLGRINFDYETARKWLPKAHVYSIQEVIPGRKGAEALRKLARQIGDDLCVGVVANVSRHETYGLIWDPRAVTLKDIPSLQCQKRIWPLPSLTTAAEKLARPPMGIELMPNGWKKSFLLVTVHLVSERKQPANEVMRLFRQHVYDNDKVVVVGDFNLTSIHPAFRYARQMGFRPAFLHTKTSLKRDSFQFSRAFDNAFYRSLSLVDRKVIDVNALSTRHDYHSRYHQVSDHAPILISLRQ